MSWMWKLGSVVVLLTAVAWARPANPYDVIDKQGQAQEVLQVVQGQLVSFFGMKLRIPVAIHLVEPKEMDKLLGDSPYHGAEIGLYTGVRDGRHQVYVMKGWSRDYASGITAHELTHAWQYENAPKSQDQVVKEGFAKWIEYRYYDRIGAYTYSNRELKTADPVYGVGFFAMLDAEAVLGPTKLADEMRRITTISELPKKKAP